MSLNESCHWSSNGEAQWRSWTNVSYYSRRESNYNPNNTKQNKTVNTCDLIYCKPKCRQRKLIPWIHHHMETLPASLACCERGPSVAGWLFSQRASNDAFWLLCFCCWSEKLLKRTALPVLWNAMTLIWRRRNSINIAHQTFYIMILDDYNSIHISMRYEILCYLIAKQLHNRIKCVDTRFITCTATHKTTLGDHVSGEYSPQNMNRLQPRRC